ncbi:MAG: 16S rRNA (guanine(527)-N(7))-methyltransferase RsmG [Bacillota bacterium]|nr:16S rRNA (guanine(527)-N(7))-methyltransferase RsmG [Bacillota bacterium]
MPQVNMGALEIIEAAKSWRLSLTLEQAIHFVKYLKLLLQENEKYNLTRIIQPEDILEEHFLDSLAGLKEGHEETGPSLLDLGSGAGFPGLPLKIFLPHLKVTLLDASRKKLEFLRFVIKELELEEVGVLHQRAEDLGRGGGREGYSWVTARALAPLVVIAEIALPLVKVGGFLWALKGPAAFDELNEAEVIIRLCGGKLIKNISYDLPRTGKRRNILIFKKIRSTESSFPRKAGIPQKRPYIK